MKRNLGDRAEHRPMTAGITLGSGKAPEGFYGKKWGLKLTRKPMKILSRMSGLDQEQNRTRFLGQGRQQEGGVSSGPCYYSACAVFLSFISLLE